MSDTTSEPFHVFPEHPNQSLHTFVFLLVILGSIGSVVWHVCKDQAARTILSTGGCRLRAVKFALLYVLSPFLILSPIIIPTSGDPTSVFGLVLLAIAYEGILNWYLLFRYGNAGDSNNSTVQGCDEDSKVARLGRRLAYVTSLVLCGASVASSQFDDIDYYGPVRITGAKLYADRPEQSISKVAPTYYYFYTLQEKMEWGNGWGCPSSRYGDSKWCEYSHLLDKDEYGSTCKKRIDCPGKPQVGEVGECATASQQLSAQLYLIKCVSDMTENGQTPDFSSGRYFNRDTPPWLDFPNGTVAVIPTRTVAASCKKCEAFPSVPPDHLAKQARVAWSLGFLMVATTAVMLFYDRFRYGKTQIYSATQTHDLELS